MALFHDVIRVSSAVIFLAVALPAFCKVVQLLREGEPWTDRLWLCLGIAINFMGNSIWGITAALRNEAVPWAVVYGNPIIAVAGGATILAGLIHARTFTHWKLGEWGWITLLVSSAAACAWVLR